MLVVYCVGVFAFTLYTFNYGLHSDIVDARLQPIPTFIVLAVASFLFALCWPVVVVVIEICFLLWHQ